MKDAINKIKIADKENRLNVVIFNCPFFKTNLYLIFYFYFTENYQLNHLAQDLRLPIKSEHQQDYYISNVNYPLVKLFFYREKTQV